MSLDTSSAVTIIRVHDRDFVAGLYWHALTKPRSYMAEARSIGNRDKMDIVSIRRSKSVIQAGFVQKRSGVEKGMYSLATVLADKLQSRVGAGRAKNATFMGAFRVDEHRYAMLAVKGGGIMAGSDMIADGRTIAEHLANYWHLMNDADAHVFVPPEFEMVGEELNLADLLRDPKRQHQLKPLSRQPTKRDIALISVGALLLLAGGGYAYWTYLDRVEAEERAEAMRKAMALRLQQESGKTAAPMNLVRPWIAAPTIAAFARRCQDSVWAAPLSVGGWTFARARCTSSAVDLDFKREAGATILNFRAHAGATFPGAAINFIADGNQGTVTVAHRLPAGGDDPIGDVRELRDRIASHFQGKFIDISITPMQSKAVVLPGQDPKELAPQPDWQTFTFSAASQQSPMIALSGMDGTSARLSEIVAELNGVDLKWSINGELYGK